MNFIDTCMEKWNIFCRKAEPTVVKVKQFLKTVANKVVFAWNYVVKFKKLFLCVPVAVMAVLLAIRNLLSLPALVGLWLQANGEFSFEIVREVAVLGPLVVTAICLLLVFASKRTLTPWLVSVFSLVLPLWILLINTFSA